MKENMLRLAIVGCGYVSNYYRLTLPLHPELELIGVLDSDAERARRMAKLSSSQTYSTLEDLLCDGRVDIVLNLTNPANHFEITRACLEAGKHVYTEKPLALDLSEAKQLVELAEQKNLYLSSAPCTLLNQAAQTMWKALRENKIGTVRLVYAEMDDGMIHRMPVRKWVNEAGTPWPYRDEFETGCTVEHAGYVLTWLSAFFGPAETVTGFSACLVPDKLRDAAPGISTPDFSVACIRFASGVVARMTCGIYAPGDHSLRIFGDDGMMSLHDTRHDLSRVFVRKYITIRRKMMLTPWERRYKTVAPSNRKPNPPGSKERDFCSGIAEMVESIQEGRRSRLDARFCLHVNEMTLAVHNALDTTAPYRMTTTFDPIDPMPWAKG